MCYSIEKNNESIKEEKLYYRRILYTTSIMTAEIISDILDAVKKDYGSGKERQCCRSIRTVQNE